MNKTPLDITWILTSAALVFIMQAGFLCLEAGLTRKKNSINVAVKNVADFALSILLFWAFGFALMFGASRSGWFGTTYPFVELSGGNMWLSSFFLFQAVFCGTAVTIISGAVAERVRFSGYLVMALLVGGIIYPLYGHWCWGGAMDGQSTGWLAKLGFVDFAGSSVVHSVGGWAALAGVLIIGPRTGRFAKGCKPAEITASNLPLAMLGVMLLWFGWIGFNGGSTLEMNETVPGIIVNTMLAASAGLIAASLLIRLLKGYMHPCGPINGVVAGLVAITACCHVVSSAQAVIIGAIAGVLAILAMILMDHSGIDDAVSAVPCHMVAGVWGTLAVGIFGDLSILDNGLSRTQQISVQMLAVTVCALWAGLGTWLMLKLVSVFMKMRVATDAENIGLNVAIHHARSDLQDFVAVIDNQSRTGDLSLRAPIDPFTEVGQIASYYNQLMDVLQKSKTDLDDLRLTQRALRQATKQAQSSDQAKSEFLANMSHEIRTPLHGILSFASFGVRKIHTASPEKLEDYFNKINISGQRLLLLINDLLDLAKLESGKMQFEFDQHDVTATIRNVVDEFVSLLSERDLNINFVSQMPPTDTTFDQLKLMQVIRNLVNNAIKFSPPNSTIELLLSSDSDQMLITVRDYGMGIPQDELEAIFDKFIQSSKTSSGAGGTGLGLAICQEIVQGHGGRIWAENHPDGGAVFRVSMPLTPPKRKSESEIKSGETIEAI